MTREDVEEAMKEKWKFERDQEQNLKGELATWKKPVNCIHAQDLMPMSSTCGKRCDCISSCIIWTTVPVPPGVETGEGKNEACRGHERRGTRATSKARNEFHLLFNPHGVLNPELYQGDCSLSKQFHC